MAQREVGPEEVAKAKRESVARQMMEIGGFLYARILDDGRCLYLAPAPLDPKRILLGIARSIDVKSYYALWEYTPGDDAMWRAVLGWDGNDDPEGFRRLVARAS